MSNDPSQRLIIAQLAEMLCLSPSALHWAFANDVGATPIAWLNQIRVAKMARLLQETIDALVVFGRRAGWKNRTHASRQFKARTAITPSEYRKK
ncbi:helix-turn-helix domain-containing protein [Corynebacterium timonense]|uniref:helix-turn-helix transcriptional regulator n=2 Tax=Corynebacterium timonense TaxID=441500 RepID=UPI0009F71E63